MWLICFKPAGTSEMVPQLIFPTEQEAKIWLQSAPFSVVGTYIYMFVPLAKPNGYFQRQEQPYYFPSDKPIYPMWADTFIE